MLTVKAATPEMFPRVYLLLQQFNVNNPAITLEDWRGLFNYPWRHPDDPTGFVLANGEEIVGYLGTVCHRRQINGRQEKFCNLTSWVTRPTHRQHSIMLFTPILKLTDYTVTNQTPVKHTLPLLYKFGFRLLDDRNIVLYPVPDFGSLFRRSTFQISTNPRFIAARLKEPEATIFRDHQGYHCGHLLLHNRDTYSYAVFTRTKGRKFHFSRIHHISNKPVFFANLNQVRLRLPLAGGALFTMIESRFAPTTDLPHSRVALWKRPTLFKSATLTAADIDNLYSELILLNL